jgi:hypothetical protein
MANPDRHHHAAGFQDLAIFERQVKITGGTAEGRDCTVFHVRDETVLKFQTVPCECLQRHWQTDIGVGQAIVGAISAESEGPAGVVETGGEALGFQPHAFWHTVPPHNHWVTKYPEIPAVGPQMRGKREPVRPRPNNRDIRGTCTALKTGVHALNLSIQSFRRCSPSKVVLLISNFVKI